MSWIKRHGEVRHTAEIVGCIDSRIGPRRGVADARNYVAGRRKADHADSVRIDAKARRLLPQQAHGALGVLKRHWNLWNAPAMAFVVNPGSCARYAILDEHAGNSAR